LDYGLGQAIENRNQMADRLVSLLELKQLCCLGV
jgi:hypothetical protein